MRRILSVKNMGNSFEQSAQQEQFERESGHDRFEAIKGFHLPIIRLGDQVSQDVVDAVEHAALVTLHEMEIPLERFKGFDIKQLVNLEKKNENGLFLFERVPDSDMQIPLLVVSSLPLYDFRGRETIALYEPKNTKIFLNLRRIEDAFKGSPGVGQGVMTGIVAVEEVIHFIQDKYWHREFRDGGNTDYQGEDFAEEHDTDPLEAEANKLKKQVFNVLYPELQIKVRGIDY